ncbi:MAG: pitrilysin family protein [Rhizobiaceae bacterium]
MNATLVRGFAAAGRFARVVAAAFVLLALAPLVATAMDIREIVSPKGVRAWFVEDHTLPIVTVRFALQGGANLDPAGREGLASLMSTLFDEGAGDLDSDAFQEKQDEVGIEMSFDAKRDALYGSFRVLSDDLDSGLELLALAVSAPRYDSEAVERMRTQLIAGIESKARDPNTEAGRRWRAHLYGDHPYGRDDDGTTDSLGAISTDDLRAGLARLFSRANLVVAVVGDIDGDALAAALDRVFGHLPERSDVAAIAEADTKFGGRIEVDAATPQTSITMAWPGIDRADPDFMAAFVMNHIFGGGTFSSRLFNEVREKRGLAYGVDSGIADQRYSSLLLVSTATRADRAAETIAIILDEAAKIARDGVTEKELADAKKNIIGSYAIANLSSSTKIARTLVELQLIGLPRTYLDEREALINAVTADQVRAIAARLFAVDPNIMAVGPAGAIEVKK